MAVCPLQCSMDATEDLRSDVALSLRLFLHAIRADHGPFSRFDFVNDGFHLDPNDNFLILDEQDVKEDGNDNRFGSLGRSW